MSLHAPLVIQFLSSNQPRYDRPVTGLMALFLGGRYSIEQLSDTEHFEYLNDAEREAIATIRAFPVTPLIGARVHTNGESDLTTQLEALLRQCCPGVEWHLDHDLSGPLRKYGFLHTSVAAPPDVTTGQPMALELFADTVQRGAHDLSAPNAPSWLELRCGRGDISDWDTTIEEPLTLCIKAATYANVSYPGIGVGFYL